MADCKLCQKEVASTSTVEDQWLIDVIRAENPSWVGADGGCPACLAYYERLGKLETQPGDDLPGVSE